MFKIDQLSCGYGQSQILHDLDLNVAKREIVAVMGRNGMGKTTLFKSLMGILPQWKGQVSVDGHDVSALETHERINDAEIADGPDDARAWLRDHADRLRRDRKP